MKPMGNDVKIFLDTFPLPNDMLIEITNICNHACIFCPHRVMKNKQGEIDVDFCKRIMQEAFDMGVRRVGLYTTGEMFCCKNLIKHIENAKKIGFEYMYADTNGALATKEKMREVFLAGLDSIKFSINAADRENYRLVHGRDDFDIVMKNLKDCSQLRDELNLKDKVKIFVSYIISKYSEKDCESFKEKISPYIDAFFPHAMRLLSPNMDFDVTPLLPIQKFYKNGDGYFPIPCPLLHRIHITYTGLLSACCIDFNHEVCLADLKKMSLQEAWYCDNVRAFRKRHFEKNLEHTLCGNCLHHHYSPDYEALKF